MLKEFDLDAPGLPKEARHSFRLQTRTVTALYERLFKPFRHKGKVWKVLIEVVPAITKPSARDLLGVLTVQLAGNPQGYLLADRNKKQRLTLDWLMAGILKIAHAQNWSTAPFEKAAAAVEAAKFQNTWIWKRPLWNHPKNISAEIVLEHDIDETRINAVFRTSKGELVGSDILCRTQPSEFSFVPCLGKLRWIDDQNLELSAKTGAKTWTARVRDSVPHPQRGNEGNQ